MTESTSFIRPRNVLMVLGMVLVLTVGGYGYFLANMAGALPWQTDPTPISNDVTPFAGTGFENLPTIPPKKEATDEPAVSTPAATPAASPQS